MILLVLLYFSRGLVLIFGVFGLVGIAVVYIRIYLAVQRHKNQIHFLQVQQAKENDEIENSGNLVRSAFGIIHGFLLFLLCCLPSFICIAVYF